MITKMKLICLFLVIVLISGCGPLVSQEGDIPTAEIPTVATLPIFNPTAMQIPSQTASPFPTQPPLPIKLFSIDRLRIIYEKDGNIYLQNGLNTAQKLTSSGVDRDPIVSDNGEIILFYRGKTNNKVYSIRADGTEEKLLIDTMTLRKLSQGEVKGITFIPGSTDFLFNTYLCNIPLPGAYDPVECVVGLYKMDFFSGKIHRVVTGLSGNRLHDRNFAISPNGQFLSVAASGHVDVYVASGGRYEIIKRDAITYLRTLPVEYLATQYWFPDSSGFVSVIANSGYYGLLEYPSTFAAYRYNLGDDRPVLIPLDPMMRSNPALDLDWALSPDRNWIFYHGRSSNFLGNLSTGATTAFPLYNRADNIKWSPGSQYFLFYEELYSVHGSQMPVPASHIGYSAIWLDDTHYLYNNMEASSPQESNYAIGVVGGNDIPLPETFEFESTSKIVILDP